MIDDHDFQSVTAWLEECHRPLLLSHQRPDGDSLGALAAMYIALRDRGLEPELLLFDQIPRQYSLFEPLANWRPWNDAAEIVTAGCDSVVVLDTCALSQLEPAVAFLRDAPRTLVIDHHATRDAIGVREGDLRLFDETASAASLMVAEWALTADVSFSADLATALFVGIATDCGWFRFSNTDARTLRVAGGLVDAGADPGRLYSEIHQNDPPAKLRLIARLLENLELTAGGRMAVMRLRRADLSAAGADESMTSDLVNEASRLGGVEVTLLFTEESNGVTRVNFRSRRALDVAEIARLYGGGGHARAAGARLRGEFDETVSRVIADVGGAL